MWMLSFLPDSFLLYLVNTILIIGAISFFLTFFVLHKILNKFPTIAPYHLLLQVISAVLLISGIYFKGSYSTEIEWREKVKVAEEKVQKLELKAHELNAALEKKTTEKNKVITQRGQTIYQYIDREVVRDKEVVKFVEKCPIPEIIIKSHNAAATNTPLEVKK